MRVKLTCQYCGVPYAHLIRYTYELNSLKCDICGQEDWEQKEASEEDKVDYYAEAWQPKRKKEAKK